MRSSAKWDGYGSYEAYINRGLDGLFSAKQQGNVVTDASQPMASSEDKQPVQQSKPKRIKPKDVHDIVASYAHHKGDKQWLVDMLLRLPLAKREPVMLRYSQVYNSARSAGAEINSQTGQARRDANTWLRDYIEQ